MHLPYFPPPTTPPPTPPNTPRLLVAEAKGLTA